MATDAEHATAANTAVNASEAEHAVSADKAGMADNAEEANHVKYCLTIKKQLINGMTEDSFDGSKPSKEIDFVPSTGGAFSGHIQVPPNNDETFDSKAVLNYGDITEVVLKELKNNSVLYEWDGNSLTESATSNNGIKSVSIITGPAGKVNRFAAANYISKQFSAFIYIAGDGSIYFGTSEANMVAGVTVSANTAINAAQLTNKHTFKVDFTSGASSVDFNGTSNVTLKANGILPIANGGTGTNDLKNIKVGSATNADSAAKATNATYLLSAESDKKYNADDISTTILDIDDKITANSGAISDIIDGTTTVAKATSANTAANATKATNDNEGKQISKNYYRCKTNTTDVNTITLSTSTPSGGYNGDIWIKY